MERFSQFLHIREQIASYLSTVTEHVRRLGGEARVSHLNTVEQELLNNDFRVMVCGEFKRGKSCLVNALLGDSVVPMKVAPCTGTITELSYGPMPFLTIFPNTGNSFSAPFEELKNYATSKGTKGIHSVKLELNTPAPFVKKRSR